MRLTKSNEPEKATMLTVEALEKVMARRCGLDDPETFTSGPFANAFDSPIVTDEHAGTGRTTRMLLQALVARECGATVEIVVTDQAQADDLRMRLNPLFERLDYEMEPVDHEGLWFRWPGCTYDPHEPAADVRLVDHAGTYRGQANGAHSVHDGIGSGQ